jgi:hypothetical protein
MRDEIATEKCNVGVANNCAQHVGLATMTGGKQFEICAPSFAPAFQAIAEAVVKRVLCRIGIPDPPAGQEIDTARINVTLASTSGRTPVLRDDAKPCAEGAHGWQISADGKHILLCGDACTAARAGLSTKAEVELRCTSKVRRRAEVV